MRKDVTVYVVDWLRGWRPVWMGLGEEMRPGSTLWCHALCAVCPALCKHEDCLS